MRVTGGGGCDDDNDREDDPSASRVSSVNQDSIWRNLIQ